MNNAIKNIIAATAVMSTLIAGMGGINASAYTHTYSTFTPYKSGANVYFGGYATNKTSNNSVAFRLWGDLYNNNTNASISGSLTDLESNVGQGIRVTLRSSIAYSELPNDTRCVVHISAYSSGYSSNATPSESYVNDVYYCK